MDTSNELYFDGLCRTCMHEVTEAVTFAATVELAAEQSQQQMQSIFEGVAECGTMRIFELLATTMPQLQFNLSDELPQKVCRECFEVLLSIFRFQQMCIASDQQMREMLDKKFTDIKISMPAPLAEAVLDTKEFLMAEVCKLHEAPMKIAKDPLESGKAEISVSNYLEIDLSGEDINNDRYGEQELQKESRIADVSIKIAKGTPTTAQKTVSLSEEVSGKEDVDSGWTNDMPKLRVRKISNLKKMDVTTKEKVEKLNSVQKEQVHPGWSTHACNVCNKSFTSRTHLLKHLRRHKKGYERKSLPVPSEFSTQNVRFGCDVCGRQYYKPETLHKHKQTHSEKVEMEERNYVCDICANKFTSQRALTRHKRLRHCSEGAPKLHVCKLCNKGFKRAGRLKEHIRTHTGEQPYLCAECGKAFNSGSTLSQHLLRHTGVKRYECPDCPKKFVCLSNLASHKAVHSQAKPNVCDVCGSAFSKPYQLRKHKVYHNGEKPYKCEYCEMRFVRVDHQRRHMLTHTGEKPYKCKYCERAFAQSNDLIKHLRVHLGANVYKCELCPSGFRLAAELRVHFALHKNDDEETRTRNLHALEEEEAKLHLSLTTKQQLVPAMAIAMELPQPKGATAKWDG